MSQTRKEYILKLITRCIILLLSIAAAWYRPQLFEVLDGWNFFSGITLLHLLWLVWVVDMLYQIVHMKNRLALGSMKVFPQYFRPSEKPTDIDKLHRYIDSVNKGAVKVVLLWSALIAVIGVLYFQNIINKTMLFLICVFFYVCDLICVLVWCPFRLIMKTRCCTTCRIFNWDHMMMFSPLIFTDGFFCVSLVVLAVLCLVIWEVAIFRHPERFWDRTNVALKCSECTDKLCTQYCEKCRKK